jgi:hypothetical protein
MSAISPVNAAATQTAIATESLPSDPANTASQTDSSGANQPAVIVSLSSTAGATQNGVFAQPLSDQVASVLNLVSGANALANNAVISNADYAKLASEYGVAIANRDVGTIEGAVAQVSNAAIAGAARLGIQVLQFSGSNPGCALHRQCCRCRSPTGRRHPQRRRCRKQRKFRLLQTLRFSVVEYNAEGTLSFVPAKSGA